MKIPPNLLRLAVLATGLQFSATLWADSTPAPVRIAQPGQLIIKPSQMVTLLSSGNPCPNGGYALDQVVDPATLTLSPFSLAAGQALVLTDLNGPSTMSRQTATNTVPILVTGAGIGLNDLVLKHGVMLCMNGTANLQNPSYNFLNAMSARGHIVIDY